MPTRTDQERNERNLSGEDFRRLIYPLHESYHPEQRAERRDAVIATIKTLASADKMRCGPNNGLPIFATKEAAEMISDYDINGLTSGSQLLPYQSYAKQFEGYDHCDHTLSFGEIPELVDGNETLVKIMREAGAKTVQYTAQAQERRELLNRQNVEVKTGARPSSKAQR